MRQRSLLVAMLVLVVTSIGCNRLKGDKGDTGAAGQSGSNAPAGAPGQFFEFTGTIPTPGIVNIGNLGNDSIVAVFSSNSILPHNSWWPHVGYSVSYATGDVTFEPFSYSTGWTYKIIVIHNPSSQSSSLL